MTPPPQPQRPTLFTIGHSNHDLPRFVGLLRTHSIDTVCDVRSQPFSSRFPHFNKNRLADALAQEPIQYVWLGGELGARRDEPELYDDEGRADYARIAATGSFRRGIAHVLDAAHRARRVALMCAEREPLDCHRTILVARHLRSELDVHHVLADGTVEAMDATESRMLQRCGLPSRDLFRDRRELVELAYEQLGCAIAWQRPR